MPFIPLFVQNELQAVRDANLISAFNFCNPFDDVLPPSDAVISALDMQHLWGLSTSIVTAGAAVIPQFCLDAILTIGPVHGGKAILRPIHGGNASTEPIHGGKINFD